MRHKLTRYSRRYLALILMGISLSSCGTHNFSTAAYTDNRPVRYDCENDVHLSVLFSPAQALISMLPDEQGVVLNRETSASGFLYANANSSIRGKGAELVFDQQGAIILCQSKTTENN